MRLTFTKPTLLTYTVEFASLRSVVTVPRAGNKRDLYEARGSLYERMVEAMIKICGGTSAKWSKYALRRDQQLSCSGTRELETTEENDTTKRQGICYVG